MGEVIIMIVYRDVSAPMNPSTLPSDDRVLQLRQWLAQDLGLLTGELTVASADASAVSYEPEFVGSVATTVKTKLQQTVSVKDFGAVGDWNGTQSVAGTGTDDTAAIQAAIDYCLQNDAELFFPPK